MITININERHSKIGAINVNIVCYLLIKAQILWLLKSKQTNIYLFDSSVPSYCAGLQSYIFIDSNNTFPGSCKLVIKSYRK